MTNQITRFIAVGPSREEIFDALRLMHEGRRVWFTLAPESTTSKEAASGHRLPRDKELRLSVCQLRSYGAGDECLVWLYDGSDTLGSKYLRAHYHYTRRQGVIETIEGWEPKE